MWCGNTSVRKLFIREKQKIPAISTFMNIYAQRQVWMIYPLELVFQSKGAITK
jgi:hypothetical protein